MGLPVKAMTDAFLSNPNSWQFFVNPGFVHPKTLDPNYVPPNRGPLMTVLSILNIILTFFIVIPRLYSRLFIVRSFRLDDWLIIPAFFSHLASTLVIMYAVRYAGLGKHIYDCTPAEILQWYVVQYVLGITMLTGIFLTRFSILCFIKSFIGPSDTKTSKVIIAVQVINCLVWPATMLPAVFMCTPEFRTWNLPVLILSKCISTSLAVDLQMSALAMGFVGVSVDIACLVLPMRVVWNLRLPKRQRIIVSGLFSIGSLACIASLCKAVYIAKQLTNSNPYDFNWTFVPVFVSAEFEQTLALVSACGPGLKPLFSRAFPVIRDTFLGGASWLRSSKNGSDVSGNSSKLPPSSASYSSEGKKSADGSETGMIRHSVTQGLWRGDLESGYGVAGVPSVWLGETEESWAPPRSEQAEIPRIWIGEVGEREVTAVVPPVWLGELNYTNGEEQGGWRGGRAI